MRASETMPFAPYGPDGNTKTKWYGRLPEMLAAVLASDQPGDIKERASVALKFYFDTVNFVTDFPRPADTPQSLIDSDIVVAKMFAEMYAESLWNDPDDCLIKDCPQKTYADGLVRVHPAKCVMSKRFHGPEAFRTQTPVAPSPYAVPLPVIPPSDLELAAIAEQEKRFSTSLTENVAANVAKIAQIRQDGVKPLTNVEQVELSVAANRRVQTEYEAALENLNRLKRLRDESLPR